MRFGQLGRVVLTRDRREAYLFFNVLLNAYICCKLLSAIKLRTGGRELGVEWVHSCGYHPEVASEVHNFIRGLEWGEAPFLKGEQDYEELNPLCCKQSKFTCRFDIQIDNEREFQVARRIIGPKGCHMKRIIEEAVTPQLKASSDNLNELLKLRLRGRGSGYKEGAEQQESAENLHLCVSAKDETAYN